MSRKGQRLFSFVWATALLFIGAWLAGWTTSFLAFSGAIVGLVTAYLGSHVGHAWVDSKTPEQIPPPVGE